MEDKESSVAHKIIAGVVLILLLGVFLDQVAKFSDPQSSGQPCVANPEPAASSNSSALSNSTSFNQTNSSLPERASAAPALAPATPLIPATGLELTTLASLDISNSSSTISELANVTFWQEVMVEWKGDVLGLASQTYISLLNSSADWQGFANQTISDPPQWLSVGFIPYYQSEVVALDATASANPSGAAALAGIRRFAASVAGGDLTVLDFFSFNGLTALRTYFETGDASQAICASFPAQFAALYTEAFDPSVPSDLRAQYLGQALAMTTFMVALGGATDGFGAKFQAAVEDAGLGDAWPTVKPYLGDIGEKVSGAASEAVLSILQALAGKFPGDVTWVTGETSARADAMVTVLKDDGLPQDFILGEIQKVAEAASSSTDENGAADAADELSYHDGNWIQLSVRSQNRLSLYSDITGRTEAITMRFLQENVLGFDPAKANFVLITYREVDDSVTNVYNFYGGPGDIADGVDILDNMWTPKAPSDVAQPGTVEIVQFSLLTVENFVSKMPLLQYSGFLQGDAPWMTLVSQTTSYSIDGDGDLEIGVTQAPFAGFSLRNFQVTGTDPTLGWDGKVVYLDFQVVDAFDQPTEMRLVYNGYSNPQIRITSGGTNVEFSQVLLISSDGVKMKFLEATGGGGLSVATIYVESPTSLYNLGSLGPGNSAYQIGGASAVYQIDQVQPTRSLELTMVEDGSDYDKGVVGAEIAYTVGTEKLGLKGLMLSEPSEGGVDLITQDGTTVIQARLVDLSKLTDTADVTSAIQGQLAQMTSKLQQDFDFNPSANVGYAIISYLNNQGIIQTVIVAVPRT